VATQRVGPPDTGAKHIDHEREGNLNPGVRGTGGSGDL
jgi:hypothetical protein